MYIAFSSLWEKGRCYEAFQLLDITALVFQQCWCSLWKEWRCPDHRYWISFQVGKVGKIVYFWDFPKYTSSSPHPSPCPIPLQCVRKGPQLRTWSSWGPNCRNGPHLVLILHKRPHFHQLWYILGLESVFLYHKWRNIPQHLVVHGSRGKWDM